MFKGLKNTLRLLYLSGVERVLYYLFYFLVELGGLSLVHRSNPMSLAHTTSPDKLEALINEAFELEKEHYTKDEKTFLNSSLASKFPQYSPHHDIS